MSSLYHHGIKGMKWGVRRGPPYPLGESGKTTEPSMTKKGKQWMNGAVIRNVAIGAIAGTALIGAAYLAKKHDVFSKLRVSDLRNAASEVRFMKYEKGDRRAEGLVFTPLSFQAMRNRYRDCAKNMDEIVFPDKEKSLLDPDMKSVEATLAISDAIGERMRQASETGDLIAFATAVSEGAIRPDDMSLTHHELIKLIDSNRSVFETVLKSGRDFGDLKNKEAGEVLEIIKNLAEIYRDER